MMFEWYSMFAYTRRPAREQAFANTSAEALIPLPWGPPIIQVSRFFCTSELLLYGSIGALRGSAAMLWSGGDSTLDAQVRERSLGIDEARPSVAFRCAAHCACRADQRAPHPCRMCDNTRAIVANGLEEQSADACDVRCRHRRAAHPDVLRRDRARILRERLRPRARDACAVRAGRALRDAAADRDNIGLSVAHSGHGAARAVEREGALLVRGPHGECALRIAGRADGSRGRASVARGDAHDDPHSRERVHLARKG